MAASIQSPAKGEVGSVIRFLNTKGERPAEIHKQTVAVYGNIMNRQNVTKWREFSEGRTDVHDEQRSGRSSLISDDLPQEIEGEIRTNRRVTIRELHHIIPEVSKTTIHEAVTEKLRYRKLCARWVPKMLTDDHKTKRSFVRRELLFSEHQPQQQVTNSTYANKEVRVAVVARSKAWVCGSLLGLWFETLRNH